MSVDKNYEELREQYQNYVKRAVAAGYGLNDEDLGDVEKEVPRLEKQLLDFCLSNGHDLEDLRQFFHDAETDALAAIMPG
jgi:hypothetical protein